MRNCVNIYISYRLTAKTTASILSIKVLLFAGPNTAEL